MAARSRTTLARICSAGRSSTRSSRTQLVEHARRLESLTGHPVRAFSYPYGRREDAKPMLSECCANPATRPRSLPSRDPIWREASAALEPSSLDGCPAWRIGPELELMPALRVGRDRLREVAGLAWTAHPAARRAWSAQRRMSRLTQTILWATGSYLPASQSRFRWSGLASGATAPARWDGCPVWCRLSRDCQIARAAVRTRPRVRCPLAPHAGPPSLNAGRTR